MLLGAAGGRPPPRRPPPPGVRGRRRHRAAAPGRLAAARAVRPVAAHERRDLRTAVLVVGAGARRRRWPGSSPSTSARATSSARRRARRSRWPARPARPTARSWRRSRTRAGAQLRRLRGGGAGLVRRAGATARVAAVALGSAVLMVIVAAMASGGFTGSLRYVALPMALLCVLSGVGWAWLARSAPRAVVAVAALAALPGPDRARRPRWPPTSTARRRGRPLLRRAARLHRARGRPRRGAALRAGLHGPFQTQRSPTGCTCASSRSACDPLTPGTVLDGARTRLAGRKPGLHGEGARHRMDPAPTC